jgi:hypothetical protein
VCSDAHPGFHRNPVLETLVPGVNCDAGRLDWVRLARRAAPPAQTRTASGSLLQILSGVDTPTVDRNSRSTSVWT